MELKGSARSGAGGKCGVRVKCEDGSWREVCEMELEGSVRIGAEKSVE